MEPSFGTVETQTHGAGGGQGLGGGGQIIPPDPFNAGVLAAGNRLYREGIQVPLEEVAQTLDLARSVLASKDPVVPPRAVDFWAETVTVAAASRYVYGDEPLDAERLSQFLEAWADVLNSWMHPPP